MPPETPQLAFEPPGDFKRTNTPDLRSLLNRASLTAAQNINCCLPGVIQSFDSSKQTCTVQIVFKKIVGDYTNLVDYPLLVDCPLMSVYGGKGYMTMPIQIGDTCLVFFSDRCIDTWFANGQISAPFSERVHDLSDGFVFIGVRPLNASFEGYNTDGAELGYQAENVTNLFVADDNSARIESGDSTVRVKDGEGVTIEAGDASILINTVTGKIKLETDLTTLRIALDSLCQALLSWVDTGGHTPNGATITLINNAKALIDGVLE